MAGMFYSLTEAAEKLGKTEDEVKQLATEGKLREFRDGSNLLFKIEEVNALLAEAVDVDMAMDLELEPEAVEPVADVEEAMELEPEAAEPVAEEAMELEPVAEGPAEEAPVVELDEATVAPVADEALDLEPVAEGPAEEEPMLELDEGAAAEEVTPDLELSAEAESTSDLGLTPDIEGTGDTSAALSDDDILADIGEATPAAAAPTDEESEIALAPETGMLGGESDITDMDTALTGEGINVLGETDGDYDVTDDSLAETVGPPGTSTEASLEEIEDDVNLDSFGSGSGLLDLSLQADDTSLGGILDEIYTADGGEEASGEPSEADMVEDMTTEADQMAVAEEEMGAPEPMVAVPTMATAIVETAPDTQSNLLGGLLFLPLLALLYTAIVTISALRGFMPSILESVQSWVWYIVGGGIVVSGLVVAASFVGGGGGGGTRTKAPKKARAKKEKKPKEKKAKKEKAPKAEKAKAPKAKKEKKSLFGKKK